MQTRKTSRASTDECNSIASGEGGTNHEHSDLLIPAQRAEMIAVAAYFFAEKRGFVAGFETADWLAAEAAIDQQLSGPDSARQ